VVRGKYTTKAGQRVDVERCENGMKIRIYTDKKFLEISSAVRLGALMTGLSLAEKGEQDRVQHGQEVSSLYNEDDARRRC
jgi:hypothetical protein